MKKALFLIILLFLGCGGGGGSSSSSETLQKGIFIDARVDGLKYKTTSNIQGYTKDGEFEYKDNDKIYFWIGNLYLGTTTANTIITPIELANGDINSATLIAYILQNLDTDSDPYNDIIKLPSDDILQKLPITSIYDSNLTEKLNQFKNSIYLNFPDVSITQAYTNLKNNLKSYGYTLPDNTITSEYTPPNISIDKPVTTSNFQPINVTLFTTAPVYYALVKDRLGQIAEFNPDTGMYVFKNPIVYPITATTTPDTFVDIDYDKKRSANDILPNFTSLSSDSENINLFTDLIHQNLITSKTIYALYQIDISQAPYDENLTLNEDLIKLLIAGFNTKIKTTTLNQNSIQQEYEKIKDFYNKYLIPNSLIPDKTRYFTFYNTLLLLDKKLLKRADTLHKPEIKYLRAPANILAQNSSFSVFDIKVNDYGVFAAAGHDEFVKLDLNLSFITNTTSFNDYPTAFGKDIQVYNKNPYCLTLADTVGFKLIDIFSLPNTPSFTPFAIKMIDHYVDTKNQPQLFSSQSVDRVKIFSSPLNHKLLMAILGPDQSFLLNAKDFFDPNKCDINRTITSYDVILNAATGIDVAFRNDLSYVFLTDGVAINGFDTSIMDSTYIGGSLTPTTPDGNDKPYNLLLVKNDNELFVSTDKGVQVFSVDNTNNLSFISRYDTEGAKIGYYPKIEFLPDKDLLILSDGYSGIKVLKYDTSFQPMLCGAIYFSSTYSSQLAKVNSFDYYNGYLYVGVDSLGVVKLNFDDIIFTHCKE